MYSIQLILASYVLLKSQNNTFHNSFLVKWAKCVETTLLVTLQALCIGEIFFKPTLVIKMN